MRVAVGSGYPAGVWQSHETSPDRDLCKGSECWRDRTRAIALRRNGRSRRALLAGQPVIVAIQGTTRPTVRGNRGARETKELGADLDGEDLLRG